MKRQPAIQPEPLRARRVLVKLLPEDDWSREFVEELDAELERLWRSGRIRRAGGWYATRLLSPRTLRFVGMMRRRKRKGGMMTVGARRMRGWGAGGAWQDLGQAARSLRREPRAVLFIVVTLALGIGSVSAMYGVADRLFLSGPPHVRAPDELVRVYLTREDAGGRRTSPWIPFLTATALQEQAHSFSGLTLYRRTERLGRIGDNVSNLQVTEVDGHYFDVLGVIPYAGRLFGGQTRGGDGAPAVISHALAQSSFGSPAAALGRTIQLGDERHTVVGVTPGGFAGPQLERVDVWVPMDRSTASNRNWWVVGRVAGGADRNIVRLQTEAEAIHRRTDPGRFYQWARRGTITVAALGSDNSGKMSAEAAVTRLLLALVGLLLLIACANVVNLLLARITRRHREVVVRLALGISRWRLIRLLVFESLLLGIAGGLVGVLVAYGEGIALRRVLLPQVAWSSSPLDVRVLAVTAAIAIVTGVLLGLLPARHANRTDLTSGLATDRVVSGRGHNRMRTALATAQLTLSSALLVCAGLFLKSFWTIRTTDLGFADDVLAVQLRSLDDAALPEGSDVETNLYERALAAARSIEGSGRAALSVGLPFLYNFGMSIWVPGLDSIPRLPGGGPYLSAVSGGYFGAVGTPILRGVGISQGDVSRQAPVVVVSRSTARTLWPGGDALGECLRIGSESSQCLRVIGVAADVHRQGYREPPSLQIYVPLGRERGRFGGMALVVRPAGSPGGDATRLASALEGIDPVVDHVDVQRLDSVVDSQVRPWRLGAVVLTLTAAIALLVSLIGVYGVLSYGVAHRRREMGVRLALGATATSLQRLVLRTGLVSGMVGVTTGICLVIAASHWLAPLLFETPVADPLVLAAVATVLVAAAVAACALPAAEAGRVDAMACLRGEG